jgi:hypothetical protein
LCISGKIEPVKVGLVTLENLMVKDVNPPLIGVQSLNRPMIYLPTDTLADWNGVLNGQKVYDYEDSKHCPPETKALVDSILAHGYCHVVADVGGSMVISDNPTLDYKLKDPNAPNVMSLDGEEFFVLKKGGKVVSLGRLEPVPDHQDL